MLKQWNPLNLQSQIIQQEQQILTLQENLTLAQQALEATEQRLVLLEPSVKFVELSKRVFVEKSGKIYLGGEEVLPQMRSNLKDEAERFLTSQLWEILNATIVNESADIALRQSEDFEQVKFAKALKHWNHVLHNMLFLLAK